MPSDTSDTDDDEDNDKAGNDSSFDPSDASDEEDEDTADDTTPNKTKAGTVHVNCAARHLCNLKGTPIDHAHNCMNCDEEMHGAMCGVFWCERGEGIAIRKESLTARGQGLFTSDSAVMCNICLHENDDARKNDTVRLRKCMCNVSCQAPAHVLTISPNLIAMYPAANNTKSRGH